MATLENRQDLNCTVLRQDDNGNRFVMAAGLSREEAEQMVRTFEARGHKQLYWVEADRT